MTWSLVAVDGTAGVSGVAVASCVALDVLQRVPGVTLTGPEVLDEAARAFADPGADDGAPPACVLAERLLRGLEAGGRDGRGDARCVELGVGAQSASLRVGDLVIEVGVDAPGDGADPLATVRSALDGWRADARCTPVAPGAGGAGGAGAAEDASTASGRQATAGDDGCGVATGGTSLGAALLAALLLRLVAQARSRSGPGASHSMQRSTSSPNGPQSRHCDR